VVLTRRELGAFFYSPMAYFVLIAVSLMAWWGFLLFINRLIPDSFGRTDRVMEPVVRYYFQTWIPIFVNLLAVPMLTMRLLSEEQRSGTLEVLLTAPVSETAVVLSKFLAALVMYVVVWVPFGGFLLSIPLSGGAGFDYRPLLSFFVGLLVIGASFISMGLFFSGLTRNQIVSMVLAVAGMITLTFLAVAKDLVTPGGAAEAVLTHVSYLEVWGSTLEGRLVPNNLLFFLSSTIVWLFLSVKVLEARKWR
jgi:ABC-type transport system involved in multi-copper enzyme maturation permease subunit